MDGRELPTTVSHDGQSGPTVTTGSITLNKDATFVASFTFLAPNGQTITNERKGTYNREGANLDLTWEGAGHTKATVDASTLTMNNEGILWKFRK